MYFEAVVVLLPVLMAVRSENQPEVMKQPAYLDSYQVEDSCQFNLCGPDYSTEFMAGQAPRVGSCSGDCHLLATNLISNKFHREFLWSNCARMCSQKYSFSQHKLYKPRFLCMETCYNSYKALSPHHNLARYCIKASCPEQKDENIHQVDCFTTCSKHVSTRVAKSDWQHWAMALAGHCQMSMEEEFKQNHRLICADKDVWAHITTSHGISQSDTMATLCFSTICQEDVKCSRNCLSHVQAVSQNLRPVWISCSKSVRCLNIERKEDQMECADSCVEQHRENERNREKQMLDERRIKQEERKQQALLAVQSSASCFGTYLRTMIMMMMLLVRGRALNL